MSQAERIARIHFLLKTNGKVTLSELKEQFEVSRPTIMRDIELMRSRLFSPIIYVPQENAYVYQARTSSNLSRRQFFDFPGVWLVEKEVYALLTLLNVIRQLDLGMLWPFISPLSLVLKRMLHINSFPMKGFHKKISVRLSSYSDSSSAIRSTISDALFNEKQVSINWKDIHGKHHIAVVSIQRFILDTDGWSAEILYGKSKTREIVKFSCITKAKSTKLQAIILPEFQSSYGDDVSDLMV